jgi:hypothetical protein
MNTTDNEEYKITYQDMLDVIDILARNRDRRLSRLRGLQLEFTLLLLEDTVEELMATQLNFRYVRKHTRLKENTNKHWLSRRGQDMGI